MSPVSSTTATAALERAHHTAESVLQAISAVAGSLEQGRRIDISLLQEVAGFLRSFADQCQSAEEDALLFPALEAKCGPSDLRLIRNLRKEHRNLIVLTAEMSEATNQYAAAGDRAAKRLARTLHRLVVLCREHIWSEDHIALPLARKILTPEELRKLFQAFQAIESQISLNEVAERISLHARRCTCYMGEVSF